MRYIFLMIYLTGPMVIFSQGVGINQLSIQPPDSSAILDIAASNKGLLIPRLSSVQRNSINKPATALLLFNTDNLQFQVNVGTAENPIWKNIVSLSDSSIYTTFWQTTGNANLTEAQRLGTKDKISLKIITNDIVRIYIDSTSSKIGINTNTPQASLHINATDAIILPVGSTAQRPTTPVLGMIRFNSTSSKLEGYTANGWVTFQ